MSLYIGSDSDVCLLGMRDGITGTYLTSGTAVYTLKRGSTTIDSGSLTYTAGSYTINGVTYADGNYFGVIDASITANLTPNVNYTLVLTFAQGDYDDTRYLTETAYYRGQA